MIIITCPSCHTNYETSMKVLSEHSGYVKCSNCGCKWQTNNHPSRTSKLKKGQDHKVNEKTTHAITVLLGPITAFFANCLRMFFLSLWTVISKLLQSLKFQVILFILCFMLTFISYYEVIAGNIPNILYDYGFVTSNKLHMQNFSVYRPSKNLLNISGNIMNTASYSARITELYVICLDTEQKRLATQTLLVDSKILQPRESIKIDTSFSLPDNTSEVMLLLATPFEMRLVEL